MGGFFVQKMNAERTAITDTRLLLPAAPQTREVLERMVLRQQRYESRYAETGNDVLREAIQGGKAGIIYSPDTIPDLIEPNKDLLETFHSPHNQGAKEVFIKTIGDQEEKTKVQTRLEEIAKNLQAYLPLVYGTSGTETNSKELGNILGAVQWFSKQAKPAIGIYFVEDSGHPLDSAITQETNMLALYAATQKRIALEEARVLVGKINKNLYGGNLYNLYNPTSTAVQKLTSQILDEEKRKKVVSFFEKSTDALEKIPGENLATTATNVPAPKAEDIFTGYAELGLPKNLVQTISLVSEYIYSHPDLFPKPNMADFRTILQGVIGLQLAHEAYGADDMPIWAVETWSNLCKRTEAKGKSLTLKKLKDKIEQFYPHQNRRVLNFACPSCKTEHGIHTLTHDSPPCGFGEIASILEDVSVENWHWGGNSGVVYYEVLTQAVENGQFVLFIDNYEANGPQSRLTTADQPPLVYPPNTRTWVIGPDMIYKKPGVVDPNGTLGTAPPSELVAAYLDTLRPSDRRTILQRWFEVSGECGLENNCGVLKVDLGSAEIKKLPYSVLGAWKTVSPMATFDDKLPIVPPEVDFSYLLEQVSTDAIFQQLEDGIFGEDIANIFANINSRVSETRSHYKRTEGTIGKIDQLEQLVSSKLHPVNSIGEELQKMRMLSAADIAWRERARLLAREIKSGSNKQGQQESEVRLRSCLESGDLKSIRADMGLITRLSAEVYDLWTDDFMQRQNGSAPERGICKAEMSRQFEQQVKHRTELSLDYTDKAKEFERVSQECQSDILTPLLKQLRKSRKRLTEKLNGGKKSLTKDVQALEKERDELLWQLLTTVGTRVGLLVKSYHREDITDGI